jgi:hypothetical protein
MNTMAGIDFIDPEDYWLDPEGNVRRMGSTEEDDEQAIIATLTRFVQMRKGCFSHKHWTRWLAMIALRAENSYLVVVVESKYLINSLAKARATHALLKPLIAQPPPLVFDHNSVPDERSVRRTVA